MPISHYFTPLPIPNAQEVQSLPDDFSIKPLLTDDLAEAHFVLMTIGASRDQACLLREHLFSLANQGFNFRIKDLGLFIPGNTPADTLFAIKEICAYLFSKKIVPIIIGNSSELVLGVYRGYAQLSQSINIVSVDAVIPFELFLEKLILDQPNFLFNYSQLGFQSYYANPKHIELLEKLYFDAYRLGYIQTKTENIEPIVRNADLLVFNLDAIRQSENPGGINAGPNGFYGEEACQLTRYAGLSDKLTSVFFTGHGTNGLTNVHSTQLLAQMIWYFLEGFSNRKNDYPACAVDMYTKFNVLLKDSSHEITFYKSNKSDRWWMQVPYPISKQRMGISKHYIVPCSFEEYQLACQDEMPDRWWKTFQKLV